MNIKILSYKDVNSIKINFDISEQETYNKIIKLNNVIIYNDKMVRLRNGFFQEYGITLINGELLYKGNDFFCIKVLSNREIDISQRLKMINKLIDLHKINTMIVKIENNELREYLNQQPLESHYYKADDTLITDIIEYICLK